MTSLADTVGKHFHLVESQIKDGDFLSFDNYLILTKIMELVEKIPHLTSDQKKEIAIEVTRRIYEKHIKTNTQINQELMGLLFSEFVLGKTIDVIVAASSGEFEINKKVTKCWKGCFRKKKKK